MAATTPFQVVTASVSGVGVNFQVTTTSQPTTIASSTRYSPTLKVAFGVPVAGGAQPPMGYIRVSTEASPTATINDIPLAPNTVTLLANPVPNGTVGIAVICSISSSTLPAIISVTPGEGGI